MNKPSEEFEDAVMHAGSLVVDCTLCGRTHFATDETGNYEKGEFEDLRAKALVEPTKYVEHGTEASVGWGGLDGGQAVIGCPCGKMAKYEKFILTHRHVIQRYFEAHAKKLRREAEECAEECEKAAEAIRAAEEAKAK